jgi:hypothetical protein
MHASLSLFVAALVGSAAANQIPNSAWYGKSSWATGSSSSVPTSSSSSSSSTPTVSPPINTAPTYTGPHPSKTTEVLTSFTTTTVCPITYTRWDHSSAEIVTSYTTSTLTVTSCKSGCNHHPTSYPQPPASNTTVPVPPTKPTHPPHHGGGGHTLTNVYPTTITTSYTKFVPCSTPVATSAGTTYYSTWLTPTALPTTYVSTCTDTYTSAQPTKTPVGPVDTCPAVKTVTVTVGGGAQPTAPPKDCKSCYEVHTLTLTNGQTSVITITHTKHTQKPTTEVKPTTDVQPTGTGKPNPPKPTGSGSLPSGSAPGYPHGTGNLKWHKPSPTKVHW